MFLLFSPSHHAVQGYMLLVLHQGVQRENHYDHGLCCFIQGIKQPRGRIQKQSDLPLPVGRATNTSCPLARLPFGQDLISENCMQFRQSTPNSIVNGRDIHSDPSLSAQELASYLHTACSNKRAKNCFTRRVRSFLDVM